MHANNYYCLFSCSYNNHSLGKTISGKPIPHINSIEVASLFPFDQALQKTPIAQNNQHPLYVNE